MKWKVSFPAPENFIRDFQEYSPLVLQILWNRGIKTQSEIENFFYPTLEKLHSPFLMKGMRVLCKEIRGVIKKRKKIGIFTDFDVDGITGAAIFIETLINLGLPKNLISLYIPAREKEGYGVNETGVKFLASKGCKVFITIDCGISNAETIELAKKLGMKPIIIDHHQVPESPPKARIIINPLQKKDKYPCKELAAAGLTFKISQALFASLKSKNKETERQLLDLVVLATIADCCPLLDENRVLVKCGLNVLSKTKRTGLRELIRFFRLEKKALDVFDVSYKLAPLLNSASRMDHASNAYKLITTDSIFEAACLVKKLNEKNRKRQEISRKILEEVNRRISNYKTFPKVIIEGDKNWPLTLAGPLAAKILERYSRPTVIFNIGEDVSQSSSRSVHSLNMVKVFEKCARHLERFGGHPLAAGCAVLNKNFEKLKDCLEQTVESLLKKESLVPVLKIDAELKPPDLNLDFYRELQKFAPFGAKNPKPRFLIKNLAVEEIKEVGRNKKHLKLLLKLSKNRFVRGFWLKSAENARDLREGSLIDLVFELEKDEWNGWRELLLKIIDIKTHLNNEFP
ncbi:MAG: single-stranded-DNA-specific exonuclease RecJ [Parcubacteria group bacterium CG11_big_fil_rev_8_21_14_0_20_39_14]|nr:MAG: single-stranded-DNA-specific exonuclease RecJ [Parcubacteria group bacterium CG11_big_fil_rev_8_21_14_0_20_39_14]PIS35575.1 MAG: single-stranded-DNA-specific exonuclease RecJ [Parcubacteria group bacterium CG08_land_8_20_14_0_20_38_56]